MPPTDPTMPVDSPATAPVGQVVELTVLTSDGGPIPDSASICIAAQCTVAGASASAAAASGSGYVFVGIAVGTQPVTITGASPYPDRSTTIEVADGTAAEMSPRATASSVTVAAPTVAPTTSATTISTATSTPTQVANSTPFASVVPTVANGDPSDPTDTTGGTSSGGAGSGVTTVGALPNTGSGVVSGSGSLLILLGAMLATLQTAAIACTRCCLSRS